MKVVKTKTLVFVPEYAESEEWKSARSAIIDAVDAVEWPPGSGGFTIHPLKQANGVKPIKAAFVSSLLASGFEAEKQVKLATELKAGNVDFQLKTNKGLVAVEWETGNISSVHRSLNKMAMALHQEVITFGVVLLASRKMYRYLTDRIGSFEELEPYFPLWEKLPIAKGVLEVIAFEHDAESFAVPPIPKGSDGNAKKPKLGT